MSKTKKTRPLIVRVLDSTDNGVDIMEHHFHEDGAECDLPSRKDAKLIIENHQKNKRTNCYYDYSYIGKNLCGCKGCTDQDGRKVRARRTRHEAKKAIDESLSVE